MNEQEERELTPVSFRLAPEQARQLTMLSIMYGGRVRALSVALDRLYQQLLKENPAFAELVAGDEQED